MNSLPEDAEAREKMPMADGLLDYFPNALAAVAEVSRIGNEQHNLGEPMHWAREKSTDHANKIMRHLIDRGGKDSKGVRHSAALAWRALALLQEEIEREEGVPPPRNARFGVFVTGLSPAPIVDPGSPVELVDALLPTGSKPGEE
jgi:hypothetical protein